MDPKGRISLPGKYREVFDDGVFVTLGQDGCLYAFPRDEWERRSAEAREPALTDAEGRAYSRNFLGNAVEASLDAQGRMVIPRQLREKAGLRRDVTVLGVSDRLEIWDREAYVRYMAMHEATYSAGALGPSQR
jgi:MraZ protein